MKRNFSTHWKASKRPGKQRKYTAKAPLHLKRKFLGVNLSKELRKKYGRRTIEVRKNDVVIVMRGKFRKIKGKVLSVNTKMSKVIIDGIQVKKRDGSKANVKMRPSKLQIVELNTDDRRRMEMETQKKEKVDNKNKTGGKK